jgi:alkylation response protein AidB-like acyl-CoA dehydrogenase
LPAALFDRYPSWHSLEVAGGPGFYRANGLERLFRDVQAARYHPLPEKQQTRFTGSVLLGLDIDG